MPADTPIGRDVVLGIARGTAGEGEGSFEIKDQSSVGFSLRRRTVTGALAIRGREVSHPAAAESALNRFVPHSQRVAPYNTVESVAYGNAHFLVTTRPWEHQLLVRSTTYRTAVFQQSLPLSRYQKLRRVRTLVQVVTGLADLDQSGLTHGDLRPGNIAMRNDGAVLLDYGLPSPLASITPLERKYLSPALLDGASPTSPDDVYGFGVLMAEFVYRHLGPGERVPLLNVSAEYLEWLSDLCRAANPSRRPSVRALHESFAGQESYEEFADYLEAGSRRLHTLILTTNKSVAGKYFESLPGSYSLPPKTTLHTASPTTAAIDFRDDALARLERALYNYSSNGIKSSTAVEAFDPLNRPPHIDGRWQALIARDYLWSINRSSAVETLSDVEGLLSSELRTSMQLDLEDANSTRADILRTGQFIHAADIAHALDYDDRALIPSDIDALRIDGVLLGVPDHGEWLYPAFQFIDGGYVPHPIIYEVARHLSPGENPWTLLTWWLTPNELLNGRAPATLVRDASSVELRQLVEAIDDAV